MKEVVRTMYIAEDGTEFVDKKACEKYEERTFKEMTFIDYGGKRTYDIDCAKAIFIATAEGMADFMKGVGKNELVRDYDCNENPFVRNFEEEDYGVCFYRDSLNCFVPMWDDELSAVLKLRETVLNEGWSII